MSRPAVYIDSRAWWQQRRWIGAAAACAVALAGAIWWAAVTPLARDDAIVPRAPRSASSPGPASVIASVVPSPSADAGAAPQAPLPSPPPTVLSTMVAPGVHVTPLGVPPGTEPVPAGPRPHDSEPEN
jgi:hypothetical protein